MYQYIESGLPYIYLVSGYRLEEGPFGETLAIEDVDALHRAIARWVVEHLDRLRGREVRFLRLEMDRTQAELAAELAVTEQTVSLWERAPDKLIPKTSDRLLRLIAEAWLDDHQSLAGAFSRLRQASGHPTVEQQPFQRVASSWQTAA
ncbi:MAG TPA: transcriptional regulator [Gammaproteobacteria bacterium]|nr:transcriptional regulator [Gammaproteobacteria bacterium]